MHIPLLSLLTIPLLPTLLTVTALTAAPQKITGQFLCDSRPTDVYICFDSTHYAICKSNYGITNIYVVPEGKDWCQHVSMNYMGPFASGYSTAFDGKDGDWHLSTSTSGPVPVTSTPGPGEDGMPTPTGHVAPPGA